MCVILYVLHTHIYTFVLTSLIFINSNVNILLNIHMYYVYMYECRKEYNTNYFHFKKLVMIL